MKHYIVTVKLPKNPEHNPRNKVTGVCPLSGKLCTDVTGEHHSAAVIEMDGFSIEDVREMYSGFHITRIEEV